MASINNDTSINSTTSSNTCNLVYHGIYKGDTKNGWKIFGCPFCRVTSKYIPTETQKVPTFCGQCHAAFYRHN